MASDRMQRVREPAPAASTAGAFAERDPLTIESALFFIERLFEPTDAQSVGVEIEMFLEPRDSRGQPDHAAAVRAADSVREVLTGRVTFEPGGQIELSSLPASDLLVLAGSVDDDLRQLARALDREGLRLETRRDSRAPFPGRVVHAPRYDAMERYFAPWEPHGRVMMRATAALQVNVDLGATLAEVADRWRLLYSIGPTLVAAFANSPSAGADGAWKSSRLRAWLDLDPARTGVPIAGSREAVSEVYGQWAIDAPLMLLRKEQDDWLAPKGISFREWISRGDEAIPCRPPATANDLSVHLSTLFPFVRPRGFFEVRYLDVPPMPWMMVPTGVIHALTSDRRAADLARSICEGTEPLWRSAAAAGLEDPLLRHSADRLLELAADSLRCRPRESFVADRIDDYRERWTSRGLSPADVAAGS